MPYEKLLNKKYTLGRRAYQNTVAQYNYLFYAEDELNELIQKARLKYQEDYSSLLSFYDYDLSDISKASIDSIIYRCNANIVLHDLRSNFVDDSYLLLAKAYLFHKNYDTAGSILQFINYSFDEKIDGMDQVIGSNTRQIDGKFSIANKETNRIWENENVRNESMVWQARNYLESNALNEGLSLLQLLKGDALFPKRLYPFLDEQLAYAYYLSESYENAANYLIDALPNAVDNNAKSRWYYLIAQMWQKASRIDEAYKWYKKANEFSPNPIIGVYAKINMVRIEAKKLNQSWEFLANDLLKITRKEKYKPYVDIIYFEMAKLAIQNKAFEKANQWLITSITSNRSNAQQKQQSFELLGDINYQNDNYAIAEIAYDSLNNILKSNKMHPKTFQKINNQLINNNTTNNTINNNNINITYIKFGDEKLSEILTDSEMMKILFDCRLGITKSVELTHFNDKRPSLLLNINSLENLYLPELKNIIITNLQNNIGYVFNGEKFEAKPKEYILGDLFDKHLDNIDGECIAFAINR